MGVLVVVVAGLALPARAQDAYTLVGPLRIRDMTPFSLLRLDMVPAHSVGRHGVRGFGLEAHLSHANTFVMSDNVEEYLRERNRREPLSNDDVEAILGLEGDAFYFDGAVGLLYLTGHYGNGDRWNLYVTQPIHYYDGGFLDATIESFHDTFGFSAAGRDLTARDRFQAILRIGDGSLSLLEPRSDYGLGDPVFGGRYTIHPLDGSRLEIVLSGAVKAPLADVDEYFSSGAWDVGAQVSVQRMLRRQAFYLDLSLIWVGESEIFGDAARSLVPTVNLAWEAGLTHRTNLLLQIVGGSTIFEEGTDPELTENKYQVSGGIRVRRGSTVYTLALTENVANFNNSPDIGIHFGFGHAFGSQDLDAR